MENENYSLHKRFVNKWLFDNIQGMSIFLLNKVYWIYNLLETFYGCQLIS